MYLNSLGKIHVLFLPTLPYLLTLESNFVQIARSGTSTVSGLKCSFMKTQNSKGWEDQATQQESNRNEQRNRMWWLEKETPSV